MSKSDPAYEHYLKHGDERGEIGCAWCERQRPAKEFRTCPSCGYFACGRCSDKHSATLDECVNPETGWVEA